MSLFVCGLQIFAQSCLRTFCVAVRSVSEAQWVEWSHALQQVAMATTCQESMLEELHDRMERELTVQEQTALPNMSWLTCKFFHPYLQIYHHQGLGQTNQVRVWHFNKFLSPSTGFDLTVCTFDNYF